MKMRNVLAALATASLSLSGLLALASPAQADIKLASECNTGWYVNEDEASLMPEQKEEGLLFEGKDLIHRSTGPLDLADVKGDSNDNRVGHFVATGATNKVVFKMETTAPYSTIVQTPDGKFWSSKVTSGKGSQGQPVEKVIDLTDEDVIEQVGKEYTGATKVITFGVGYWNESGTAVVSSITFRGVTRSLTCVPKPVKKDCEAYVFFGTKDNLCKAFPGADTADKATCTQVKYRVKLNDVKVDPWGLDGSGENLGTVGVGCESKPLKNPPVVDEPVTTPVDDETDTPVAGPTLPVTGPSVPLGVLFAGGGLLLAGVALVILGRRRKFTA